ncbi:hypothetical protein LguiA_033163 [Lonicera macranthoides]
MSFRAISGYMSPEYAMHGDFSVESDVFSFSVLVLEIITGKKNSFFHPSVHGEDFLTHVPAWKMWQDGTPLELMNPTIADSHVRNEMIRCIQMGLLCVQEDVDSRPSMATIVLMLGSETVSLPLPEQPPFYFRSRIESQAPKGLELDKSISKSAAMFKEIVLPGKSCAYCGENATRHSTVSLGVGTDSTLGIVEKMDRAIQPDEFKFIPFDPCVSRKEFRSLAHAGYECGSSEHVMEYCPLRTSGSKGVGSGEEPSIKHHCRKSIVEIEEVPSPLAIPVVSPPRGPKKGRSICKGCGHYRRDCLMHRKRHSLGVTQQERGGVGGSNADRSSSARLSANSLFSLVKTGSEVGPSLKSGHSIILWQRSVFFEFLGIIRPQFEDTSS